MNYNDKITNEKIMNEINDLSNILKLINDMRCDTYRNYNNYIKKLYDLITIKYKYLSHLINMLE